MNAHSWAEVRARVAGHGEAWRPLMRLLDWVHDEDLEEELFAHTSMFDVVFADRPRYQNGENTLTVSWDPREKKMRFRYDRLYASTDAMTKETTEDESIQVLREFFAYKFGVHRPKQGQPPSAASADRG